MVTLKLKPFNPNHDLLAVIEAHDDEGPYVKVEIDISAKHTVRVESLLDEDDTSIGHAELSEIAYKASLMLDSQFSESPYSETAL